MEHLSYLIARCTKCSAKTKISSAKTASLAKVVIKDKVGYTHKVTMFSDTIPLICEAISIEEQLLTSGMIQVSVDGLNTRGAYRVTNQQSLACLSGSEHRRPGWFLDMKYQTCFLFVWRRGAVSYGIVWVNTQYHMG